MDGCKGIILKTSYDKMGSTGNISILGKTMLEWVSLSLCEMPVVAIDNDDSVPLPALIRDSLDADKEYTVVLYSDTPLITRRTVKAALEEARLNNLNVLRMTRGFVFKTDYIMTAEKIYTDKTYYYDEQDFITVYGFSQLAYIIDILKKRILDYHTNRGVQLEDETSTFIGCEENASVEKSKMVHSYIGKNTSVGPFANLRKDNIVGDNCHIGDFVELKNCRIGDDCKIGHLTYAGDIVMGKECNVGAGVVFANYDGKDKHVSHIGDRVFIGSSSTVVAPVTLGDGSFIAAGSVITQDVPAGALAVARSRQTVKTDWKGNKYTADK